MRVYGIFPTVDIHALGEQSDETQTYFRAATEVIANCLREGGDSRHYAISYSGADRWSKTDLQTMETLADCVARFLSPFRARGLMVRSVGNCRAVIFGYDGQAFICLRHDDPAPVSPNINIMVIEDAHQMLHDTDWFDGQTVSHWD